MKNNNFLFVLLFMAIFALFSCEFVDSDEDNKDNPLVPTIDSGAVKITGSITDTTGVSLNNVVVILKNDSLNYTTTTDTEGKFNFEFKIVKNEDFYLISALEGYIPDTTLVYAVKDRTASVPEIVLRSVSKPVVNTSGYAASISLLSQSKESIGIKESGAEEDVQIIFSVQDSLGRPIDLEHKETVHFKFGSHPSSDEYLYPLSVDTDEGGLASVTMNSGFKAGVTQVIAEISRNGQIIRSKPVLVAIHGGFPSDKHFYVVTPKLNYPLYTIVGAELDFTAYAGDKYTNPVRPGTSVYFETIRTERGGIIEGSAQTDNLGAAGVKLLTEGSPYLDEPTWGAGYFKVRAHTIDETNNVIADSTIRLLSGFADIENVSPLTADIPAGGSQTFTFNMWDLNENPLSEGQTVNFTAKTEASVELSDGYEMVDRLKGGTSFSFTVFNTKIDTSFSTTPIVIKIASEGPNGKASYNISGVVRGTK